MSLAGVILAGGSSKRFGINKLQISIENVPLLIDQVFKLSFFCGEIIISTSKQNSAIISSELSKIDDYRKYYHNIKFTIPAIRTFEDKEKEGFYNRGPILGIYTGLQHITTRNALVLAFDMPFISYRILQLLKRTAEDSKKDAIIIKSIKGYEVLCGVYSKRVTEYLKNNMANKDNKISNVFKDLDMHVIKGAILRKYSLDMLNFFNINKISDHGKFISIWEKGITIERDSHESHHSECKYPYEDPALLNEFEKKWSGFFFR